MGRQGAPYDVLFIGRSNVDLTVRVPHRPAPGKSVFGAPVAVSAGGKSLNQAVAVSRLGGRASLVSRVGDDEWGHLVSRTLRTAAVDTSNLELVPGATTGAAIIEVTPDGESYIILGLSAETELTPDHVDRAVSSTAARVATVQLDIPPDPVRRALSIQAEIRIGNLVPHPNLDITELHRLDCLVVNEHEAASILGISEFEPLASAQQLRTLGPATAVVTAGARGAAYSTPEHCGTVPAPRAVSKDSTGAGDAFLGCLALQLAKATPLDRAVARAVQIGAEAVKGSGPLLPRSTSPSAQAGIDGM